MGVATAVPATSTLRSTMTVRSQDLLVKVVLPLKGTRFQRVNQEGFVRLC